VTKIIQRSFTGGEISPSLYARCDMVKYATGARTIRNLIVKPEGGLDNRAGFEFVTGSIYTPGLKMRLVPFEATDGTPYIIALGQGGGIIYAGRRLGNGSPINITGVSKASPGIVTAVAHGFLSGDFVYLQGIFGMTYLNNRVLQVGFAVTANTFDLYDPWTGLPFDTTGAGFSAYTSGGTVEKIVKWVGTTNIDNSTYIDDFRYVQSGDVMTFVRSTLSPNELKRVAHTNWTVGNITFTPAIGTPTGVINSGAAGSTSEWVVTAIASDTYEESLASSSTGSSATPTSGSPITVSWSSVSGAAEYNVYRKKNGIYGLLSVVQGTSYSDTGLTPDTNDTPPIWTDFLATYGKPAAVGYIQQRFALGNFDNNHEKIMLSKTGLFHNFTISSPLQADDAVSFVMAGDKFQPVQHLIDLGKFVAFTGKGEWLISGDDSGIIRPTSINPRQQSANGSSRLPPLRVDASALYIQSRGSIVRDIGFEIQADGYRGNDLTVFARHLFKGHTIVDWAYQQSPNGIVWLVRDDGVLLGLTYLREQQVWAWHRHDTAGFVESVAVIPENGEDTLYLVVKRVVNGTTARLIERMAKRNFTDIRDAKFMDSFATYDGRNTDSTKTMTLSGGTLWTSDETLTCTANASFFKSTDVGNAVFFYTYDAYGNVSDTLRCTITAFTSATIVSVTPNKTVVAGFRAIATSAWAKAVTAVSGLWWLEGKSVSVLGDGFVVASPNNASYVAVVVTNGVATLDQPYAVIQTGLPYISDLETLNIDTINGQTLTGNQQNVSKIWLKLESSRGVFAGADAPSNDSVDPLEGLYELKLRNLEGYNDPVALFTGDAPLIIEGKWNSNGRVFMRQVDPVPVSFSAVVPEGKIPIQAPGGP
jgi:hypothetical protein